MFRREDAEAADADDPLRAFRNEFRIPDGVIYLDGNSLGPPSGRVLAALEAVQQHWARDLVTGWDEWLELLQRVGDRLSAADMCAALQAQGVITDYRPPDIVRLGFAPLYTRFVDVWDAFERVAATANA